MRNPVLKMVHSGSIFHSVGCTFHSEEWLPVRLSLHLGA